MESWAQRRKGMRFIHDTLRLRLLSLISLLYFGYLPNWFSETLFDEVLGECEVLCFFVAHILSLVW